VKFAIGLRPSEDVEYEGLDLGEHGEEGYAEGFATVKGSIFTGAPIPSHAPASVGISKPATA
jgi:hypothetical protein